MLLKTQTVTTTDGRKALLITVNDIIVHLDIGRLPKLLKREVGEHKPQLSQQDQLTLLRCSLHSERLLDQDKLRVVTAVLTNELCCLTQNFGIWLHTAEAFFVTCCSSSDGHRFVQVTDDRTSRVM